MTTHRDPLARAYIAAQAVRELDRAHRGVTICGHCGAEYQPTPDGRRRHRFILGHTPQQEERA